MHKKKTTLQILEFVQGDHTVVMTNLLDFVHSCTEVEITLIFWGFIPLTSSNRTGHEYMY